MADWTDFITPLAIGVSGYLGYKGAKDASRANADAATASGDVQKEMFYTSRDDLLPYTETGQQGLFALADLYGVPRPDGNGGFSTGKAFTGTPGYQFRLDEGEKAINRGMASRGMNNSGARLKALSDYGQNTASAEWDNYTNALRSLSGQGQVAGTSTMSGSNQAGANIGNSLLAGGAARASGYTGQAQAVNQGVANALYYYRPQR